MEKLLKSLGKFSANIEWSGVKISEGWGGKPSNSPSCHISPYFNIQEQKSEITLAAYIV